MSLAATLVVLTLIVGGINVKNYLSVKKNAERTLQMLAQNGGEFPSKDEKPAPGAEGAEEPPKKNDGEMSPEMPFETRYFTVTLTANGDVSAVNTKNIAAISEAEAKALAAKIKESGKTSGRSGNYRFSSYAVADDRVMYIFLDCTRDFANYSEFLSASCMVSAGGFLLVAALIVVLSGVVVKPTVETYEKQKQFITDAGHELKTPLTVINADCEILEYESGGNEWTESIKNQVEKLSGLV
ncbi:MAG TPA: two-component sensor histidine kinase, partial [Clostridiales bacterium]|nr:two-component sensor histidine kinase [Clostridiales bacterium]